MAISRDLSGNAPFGTEAHIPVRNDVTSGTPEPIVIGTAFSAQCRAINATDEDTLTLELFDGTTVANFLVNKGSTPVACVKVTAQSGSANLVAII